MPCKNFTSDFNQIFWKIILQTNNNFIDILLSRYLCGFRKGFSAQHIALLEKWKNAVDKGKGFGELLTHLSKAFDCLPHELIIAKLNAYGFNVPALKLMHSYLSHRKESTKVNHAYSSCEEIFFAYRKAIYLGLFCLTSF